jgi:hypothetical protein
MTQAKHSSEYGLSVVGGFALVAASVVFALLGWCNNPADKATWWLTLAGSTSSFGVVLLAATRIASAVARAAHHTQVLDEISKEICEAMEQLLDCGKARVSKDDGSTRAAATRAASRLTQKVGLLGMCAEAGRNKHVRKAALRMKKFLTNSAVTEDDLEKAVQEERDIARQLLKLRLLA